MTLFSLLLVLGWERMFKMGERWQLDHHLTPLFRRQHQVSLLRTLLLMLLIMAVVAVLMQALKGWLFGVPQLLFWVLIGVLCVGAGSVRLHYHAYLRAASHDDIHAREAMAAELTFIHGVPGECSEREYLVELQNALLWINYRFYLAPLFWFIVGGSWGPVLLVGYAFLRAWQSWLARHRSPLIRSQSAVDAILHGVDWLPVRLVGVAYALLGHGERALPAWLVSLGDRHTPQYQVLTRLAQFSLARDQHIDKVETPRLAVALAKKVSLGLVVVVALLTIYGALV
jgi:AmpE protein